MRNLPSIKTLESAFPGKGKELRRLLQSNDAVRNHPAAIARQQECYHPPGMADMRLHALNSEMGGYGVEYIKGIGSSPSFDYINMGDTYSVTIVRFQDGRYRVTDWGSIVERGNY